MLTKQETSILKGVAILSMVFMHLFHSFFNTRLCTTTISIDGEALVSIISSVCICVPMYLFLGGYGLYKSFQANPEASNTKRIALLYSHFWVICILFISLGVFLKSPSYLGGFSTIMSNLTGFHTTYNEEWWFLFPYIMIVASSKFIFRLIDKLNLICSLALFGIVFLSTYAIIKLYGSFLYTNYFIYQPILYFCTMFSFALGAITAKYSLFNLFNTKLPANAALKQSLLIIFPICVYMIFALYIPISIFDFVIAIVIMFSLVSMHRYAWLDWLLNKLGKQSTNIWLVHTFFCYYFFSEFIYSFTYPLLIFTVTMILSYITGCIIDVIYKPIGKFISNLPILNNNLSK